MLSIYSILPWAGTGSHHPSPLSQTAPIMPYRKGVRLASRRLSSLSNSLVVVRQPESYLCQCFLGHDTLFLLWLHQYLKDILKSQSTMDRAFQKNSSCLYLAMATLGFRGIIPTLLSQWCHSKYFPMCRSLSLTNSEHCQLPALLEGTPQSFGDPVLCLDILPP